MSNIWVISDTHFSHANILNFYDRDGVTPVRPGFKDYKDMDEHMIANWNKVVKTGDKVYHLGDVFFGDKERFKSLWPRLMGSKRLIVGNHDDIKFLSSGGFFSKVYMWRVFSEYNIIMSHVPLHESSLVRGASTTATMLNVHGHIHQNKSPSGPYFNVSVENINYTPINITELAKIAKQKLTRL